MDPLEELLRAHGRLAHPDAPCLRELVRGPRSDSLVRGHAPDARTLPALALPLPQGRRSAAHLPHAADPSRLDPGLLQAPRAAEPDPLEPRLGPRPSSPRTAAPAGEPDAAGGRAGPGPTGRHETAGPPRPRHPRDLLLHGPQAHGAREPHRLRPRRRARDTHDPPGQGQEGPRRPHRGARGHVDREVPPGGAPRAPQWPRHEGALPQRAGGVDRPRLALDPGAALRREGRAWGRPGPATSSVTRWRR